jgi:flagellar basal-body rod protein FlgB
MLSNVMKASTIPILEQVVNFAQSRHNVLAGNLANIDTPGYQTRDMSPEVFQTRLRAAIDQRNQNQRQITPASFAGTDPIAQVGSTMGGMLFHDGANRGLEQEVAAIADNELQHNMAIALLTSQLRLLQTAITEKA